MPPRSQSLGGFDSVVLKAVLLAIVEGATEFLPVSSTGHLILAEELLALSEDKAFNDSFIIMIQFPAIVSVIVYFWRDLWPFGTTGEKRQKLYSMWAMVAVAFFPAAVLGLLLNDVIEGYLFAPIPVAIALAVGGVILIVLERSERRVTIPSVADLGFKTALAIGLVQCLAMIPGTSRSAATIIGAMFLGMSRAAAAEFSFFLAIPTLLGAFAYTMFKRGIDFTPEEWSVIAVGSVVSFVVAYAVIAWFMNYIQKHTFVVFGYYRIALAAIVFLVFVL
jgi:undecaprenyl-diphosphatase